MDNLKTATPAQVDTRMAELERENNSLTIKIAHAWSDLRAALGHRQERVLNRQGKAEYVYLTSAHDAEREAVAIMEANPHQAENVHAAWGLLIGLRKELLVNRAESTKLKVEFLRRGGWTRAWAVPNGHIHQSVACSTCFPTTAFGWLPQVSGLNEAEIVAQAGERACTVCYPSAPVDVLSQPSRLYTIEERADQVAKAARAAELEAKRAAKAAKGITNPDGSPLRDSNGWVIASEVTAEQAAVREVHDRDAYGYSFDQDSFDRIVAALAHKRGQSVEEVTAAVAVKAAKKVAKSQREMASGR